MYARFFFVASADASVRAQPIAPIPTPRSLMHRPDYARHRAPALVRCAALPVALAALIVCGAAVAQAPAGSAAPAGANTSQPNKMEAVVTELKKTDVKTGTGAEALAGKTVVVHYTGWLYDPAAPDGHGRKFDSSLDRKTPFTFPLGASRVIKGWDEGVVGMKVGGQRTLVIPAAKAYGDRGAGNVIPPNATLVFDVELTAVK